MSTFCQLFWNMFIMADKAAKYVKNHAFSWHNSNFILDNSYNLHAGELRIVFQINKAMYV